QEQRAAAGPGRLDHAAGPSADSAGNRQSSVAPPFWPRHRRHTQRFRQDGPDRKSTRLNSSHLVISYAVFCLKKKKQPLLYSPRRCLSWFLLRSVVARLIPTSSRARTAL